jgi:hypothetical protein
MTKNIPKEEPVYIVILQVKCLIEEVHGFTDRNIALDKYRELRNKYEEDIALNAEISFWEPTAHKNKLTPTGF